MKIFEDKREELIEYCNTRGSCIDCPLTICSSADMNFWGMDDSQINACHAQLLELTAKTPVELDNTPSIRDSGARTEFPTGAVRDIQEGKGRCDLLPLDVVAECYSFGWPEDCTGTVFADLYLFTKTGNSDHLYRVLTAVEPFKAMSDMFLEVAKHFEEGAKKYGEHNWQKGIPLPRYIDSAVRHYLKWLRGDKDEPHDRAFCWNIMCAIWTCKHKPELNTYRKDVESC